MDNQIIINFYNGKYLRLHPLLLAEVSKTYDMNSMLIRIQLVPVKALR
jgi:hypothetical protein